MKVIIDKFVPYIEGVIEPYAQVEYLAPEEITREKVKDVDALIIRTRTRVDGSLLAGSTCRFVATATIGRDHIDEAWCSLNGVTAVSAPGCNAPAVAQYVMAALTRLATGDFKDTTLAIVGVGHVGGLVEKWARSLGFNVMCVDPPRAAAEPDKEWSTLDAAAREADVITFHVPLSRDGEHATFHLADRKFFESLKKRPVIINSARGAVVDNRAWLEAIRAGRVRASVVDVWEGEPNIDVDLLQVADIATAHIAGYSQDGKIRATQMVLDAFSGHFGLPRLKADSREACRVPASVTVKDVIDSYNPFAETDMFRKALTEAAATGRVAETFERMRDTYRLRAEVHQ